MKRRPSRLAGLLLIAGLMLPARAVRAHPLLPAAVTLLEGRPGHYQLRFRRPTRLKHSLKLLLPATCTLGEIHSTQQLDQSIDTAHLACRGGLAQQEIGVSGLAEADLDAIAHVQHRSGESARALLSAGRESFVVPARSSWGQVLLQYGKLGARHMLEGADHLLFTAGLMLLGVGLRALWLLSAFTLGHSVTLVLFALSGLSLPQAPVELGIALSLIGLALSVLDDDAAGPRSRAEPRASTSSSRAEPRASTPTASGPAGGTRTLRGAALCFAVGLLHGMGFAEGLRQLPLPTHALLPALLGFNLGIELAQLLLVCVIAPCLWLVARTGPRAVQRLRVTGAYATGGLAAMWCIERALAWLG